MGYPVPATGYACASCGACVKTCFKCGVEKPLSEFYVHKQMADGHLGKCKDCTKNDMRVDRQTKPRPRAYDRERAKLPHRKVQIARVVKSWRTAHPDRHKAQNSANNAIRDGKLNRGMSCQSCGATERVEKHHPDYSQPLLVVWLCKPCHAIADKARRASEAQAV